jgi:phosphoribosylformylglycinamidine synthase subunit PurSL
MSESIHCLVVSPRAAANGASARGAGLLRDAHTLGLSRVSAIECHDLYFVEGALSAAERNRLAAELLSDPITQTATWRENNGAHLTPGTFALEVALRPGVTDPVAEQITRAAHVLGLAGVSRAATGQRYVLQGALEDADLHTLARRLLANPVIQRYAPGEIEPSFPQAAEASEQVEIIALRELDDAELLALSRDRRAALDLAEMYAIQAHFRAEGRDPTDVEFETLAQTWSEHCIHKTFKARIEFQPDERRTPWERRGQATKDETTPSELPITNYQLPIDQLPITVSQLPITSYQLPIDGLLNTFIRSATNEINAPWVISAFEDNAGIIAFDDEYEVSFKVETHNHPSAIEPFGGANTGVGGVIRDVLGVSAKPIAATDILCFGPPDLDPRAWPEGVLPPRRLRAGVVAGVQDYGNKIGLPTVNGAIVYDPGFTANPLVFCGCVGLAPRGRHPRGAQPGDRVIVLGGRTGRDGLRGATFSSLIMDAQTGEVAGASVQIGDPIVEKGLIDVIVRARDARLYHAITDCGAGGLSSAVGEMASDGGVAVDLAQVTLKYAGLAPWEIWLSEAQERMVLAVPGEALPALCELCATFGVEVTDLGAFSANGRLRVNYGARAVLDLPNTFLHGGRPQRLLSARLDPAPSVSPIAAPTDLDCNSVLLRLLAHPNIASKAAVIRLYDHEIQGGTVVKPLTGANDDGPSDACVLKPIGTRGMRGLVLSNGINAEFGKIDAYRMAHSVVDEAIRNAVAVGADPARIALLDNFCWGDPQRPETLGTLVEAARGCHDAALHYGAPFISGKDSLNNEYRGPDGRRHAIPPTLLISAIGLIEDITQAVTMDLKEPGNSVYLLGETRAEMGGSHLGLVTGTAGGQVPAPAANAPALYRALHAAMQAGEVRACHDLSEGGLAVAAAEMCIGGRLGLALSLEGGEATTALFSESNGRLLAEVPLAHQSTFEARFAGQSLTRLGVVTGNAQLIIGRVISLPLSNLCAAWLDGDVR